MKNRNTASMNIPVSTLALVVLTLCGCQSSPHAPRVAADRGEATITPVPKTASSGLYSIPEELDNLNKLFLDGYGLRQAAIKSNTSPIIVSSFSSLILIRDGKSETNRVIPAIYHSLKAIAHVPFGIFLRVDPYAKNPAPKLPSSTIAELRQYQTQIARAIGSLPSAGYSPQQLARQRKILEGCQAFLKQAMTDDKVTRSELLAFTVELGPMMLANADEAAHAQIDMMHSVWS